MTWSEAIDFIQSEFKNELEKRSDLLDIINEQRERIAQLEYNAKVMRQTLCMKNELCRKCMFSDECTDAERVEGLAVCSSFNAIREEGSGNADR